jgi:hypothetical protein
MRPHDDHLHHAAERLCSLIPANVRDNVSVSTYWPDERDHVLVVTLPPELGHLRCRLPTYIDGISVIYQLQPRPTLN